MRSVTTDAEAETRKVSDVFRKEKVVSVGEVARLQNGKQQKR